MDSTLIETTIASKVESSSEQLKALLQSLTDQASQTKLIMNTVRMVLKDVDKQGKELDKLRNKKSRASSERKSSGLPSGITKPVSISDELARFLGVEIGTLVPRNEVTKGVSSYVRKFELSDPANKQKFVLNTKAEGKVLFTLLGNPTEEVTYFNLQRYLKHHYTSVGVKTAPIIVVAPIVAAPVIAEAETPKPKKKIMVVKKKTTELSEEN